MQAPAAPARALPHDEHHTVCIVIPTVGNPSVLVPAFDRLCRHLDGLAVHIVVALNPINPEHGHESARALAQLWGSYAERNPGCHLTIYDHGAPAGFGGAINLGLRIAAGTLSPGVLLTYNDKGFTLPRASAREVFGIAPLTVVFNDDLHVTAGWLTGMLDALDSPAVCEWAEVPTDGRRPTRRMADYVGTKGIGLIGPVTNVAAGIQQLGPEQMKIFQAAGVDAFAAEWRKQREGEVLTATFLSGFCMGITRQCMEELAVYTQEGAFDWLFDEQFLIAGYEDNDLCARADFAGWRAVVAADTFIGHLGHQTFDHAFPEMDRGMRNRLTYYDVWGPRLAQIGRRTVAAYRVRFDVPNDLTLFRASLVNTSRLVDGIAVLLTRNPAEMARSEEWQRAMMAKGIPADDLQLVTACGRATSLDELNTALAAWIHPWTTYEGGRLAPSRKPVVNVQTWDGHFNERDERNELLSIAEGMGADWVLSIDHDEYLEPRVDRALLERVMTHPDPIVQQFDIAFVNHWIDNTMYRTDRPWGDGGSWTGGMRGYRLYRVNKANPRRILAGGHNGLHCGNIPAVDGLCKRISGLRMRHFGYMHRADRERKEARYNVQDPNPDPNLVGGTSYAHITHEEGMTLSRFVAEDGIGLHMLVYEGERADDIGRHLDALVAVVDRVVLVWTGEWADEDKITSLAGGGIRPIPADAGPDVSRTGPGVTMSSMAAHYGVEWIHHPLNDNIAAARNAGIEALHGTPGMGWALFLDPDEHLPPMAPGFLRRMADVGDAWGWLIRFVNTYAAGGGNTSEAVRMSRLDPERIMRMNGRVHESFSNAQQVLRERGHGNILRAAPFQAMNAGLAKTPAQMDRKLALYRRLTELDLRENPENPTAWTTLGLFWLNEGCNATGMECFARAMQCSTGEYLPFHTAGMQYLRNALALLTEAEGRMGNHSMRRGVRDLVAGLQEVVQPMEVLGLLAIGEREAVGEEEAMASLPPFVIAVG